MEIKGPEWIKTIRACGWCAPSTELKKDVRDIERRVSALATAGINTLVIHGFHFRWDWVKQFDESQLQKSVFQTVVTEHDPPQCRKRPILRYGGPRSVVAAGLLQLAQTERLKRKGTPYETSNK